MMTVDEALNIAVIHTLSIKHGIAVSEAAEAASILAAEVRRLRDEVNGLTGSLDRAEKALKEAQEQPAVAWMIHEYQGTGEKRLQFQPHIPSIRDAVTGPIVTALYARPAPAAPRCWPNWACVLAIGWRCLCPIARSCISPSTPSSSAARCMRRSAR